MDASNKKAALRFFLLTAAMTILIAAGLPSLRFQQGIPLPQVDSVNSAIVLSNGSSVIALPIGKFIITVLFVIFSAVVLVAAVRKIMGLNWKSVWLFLGKALIAVLGISLLLFLLLNLFPHVTLPAAKPTVVPPQSVSIYDGKPIESPPAVLVWIVGAATAALVILLCMRLLTDKGAGRRKLDLVGLEAQAARLALLGGGNFQDVILECYRRMRIALEKELDIERKDSMTAREFEDLLERKGVPGESVHKLTILFESVRYGREYPSPDEESEAIGCLEAIERYAHKGTPA
jgi:hypothetical protein